MPFILENGVFMYGYVVIVSTGCADFAHREEDPSISDKTSWYPERENFL